jgi:hypothetical protein
MGLGYRLLLLDEQDRLYRLSQRAINGLYDGTKRLPQFAGKRLRAIHIIVQFEHRKLVNVKTLQFRYLEFCATGYLDLEQGREEGRRRMNAFEPLRIAPPPSTDSLAQQIGADAESWLRQEIIKQDFEWQPTEATVQRILAQMRGELPDGEAIW